MKTQEILQSLVLEYPEKVRPVYKLPASYCPGGNENVKAIHLGCDPTNKRSQSFPFISADGSRLFNSSVKYQEEQLRQVRLKWEVVYAQNLCKNYFYEGISKKTKLWEKVAERWIGDLKEELEMFDPSVPVLMTSEHIYWVLLNSDQPIRDPVDFYSCTIPIPIVAEQNKLNRPLIPFYMNPKYKLSLDIWSDYRNNIIKIIRGIIKIIRGNN